MVDKGASLPSVFVSDRDLALINAIEICFPMAHQPVCNEEMHPYVWSGVKMLLCVMTLAH